MFLGFGFSWLSKLLCFLFLLCVGEGGGSSAKWPLIYVPRTQCGITILTTYHIGWQVERIVETAVGLG